MPSPAPSSPEPMICISLRYADAPRMYDWLIEAFGFEKHAAYYSEDGKTLLHGELRLGGSDILRGSAWCCWRRSAAWLLAAGCPA